MIDELTKEEFCARFVARMVRHTGFDKFCDGVSVAGYAAKTAQTYFDDPEQRAEGPEECADSDMACLEA